MACCVVRNWSNKASLIRGSYFSIWTIIPPLDTTHGFILLNLDNYTTWHYPCWYKCVNIVTSQWYKFITWFIIKKILKDHRFSFSFRSSANYQLPFGEYLSKYHKRAVLVSEWNGREQYACLHLSHSALNKKLAIINEKIKWWLKWTI